MKKKIVTLLLAFAVATSLLTGCGDNSNTDSTNSTAQEDARKESDDTKEAEQQEENLPEETTTENESADEETTERSLAGIEQYMIDAGYLTGERSQKSAEMLGAVEGFGYDCGIEIYQYDTDSDTYASVAAGEEIPLQGMDGYSVKFDAVNGEFALIFSNGEEADQTVIDAFMAY